MTSEPAVFAAGTVNAPMAMGAGSTAGGSGGLLPLVGQLCAGRRRSVGVERMKIDERAPAIARGGIEIDAHAQVVWDVLTDIDKWPSWNPDVKRASVDGGPPLHRGSVFRWKAGPGTITSTVQEIEPPRRVGWTGKTIGIDAVHVWRLEGHDGHTRVQTKESWNGPLPRLLRGPMRKTLQQSIDSALRHLKAEAERRAMGGPGPSDLDAWERRDK